MASYQKFMLLTIYDNSYEELYKAETAGYELGLAEEPILSKNCEAIAEFAKTVKW